MVTLAPEHEAEARALLGESEYPEQPPNALLALFQQRNNTVPPKLAAALVKAQRLAKGVEKDGRNEHAGYDYTRADTMVEAAKRALNEAGLAVLPLGLDIELFIVGEKRAVNYNLIREVVLLHESGEAVPFVLKWPLYMQSGKRSRDKAVGAADTTLMGYMYRDLCAIPRGLPEGEVDSRDDRGTSELDQVATPPKKDKPKKSGKSAKEQERATRPAPEKKKTKPKPKPPKEEEPAEAPAAEEEPTQEPVPEAAADPESEAPGKTKIGQVYGDEAVTRAEEEKAADGSAESLEQELRHALSIGVTPHDAAERAPDVAHFFPVDPGADDLESVGWEREVAEELADLTHNAPVARKTVNTITRMATVRLGLKAKEAKERFTQAFEFIGVDVASKQPPNGYQLRCFALAVFSAQPTAA